MCCVNVNYHCPFFLAISSNFFLQCVSNLSRFKKVIQNAFLKLNRMNCKKFLENQSIEFSFVPNEISEILFELNWCRMLSIFRHILEIEKEFSNHFYDPCSTNSFIKKYFNCKFYQINREAWIRKIIKWKFIS